MSIAPNKIAIGAGAVLLLAAIFSVAQLYPEKNVSYQRKVWAATTTPPIEEPQKPTVTHVRTPDNVKAIYMSQCVAGTRSFRDSLVTFIDSSEELNAVVIDIKDFSGAIGFPSDDPLLKPFTMKKCGAFDMKDFVKSLHEKNIYVIGRITVFQDPLYAAAHPDLAVQKKGGGVWHNYGGLAFVDVGAHPFWDYIVELSKVAYEDYGFDELNYDYIRFPSDGPMAEAVYSLSTGKSKETALEEFFKYLHEHVDSPGVVMSADLFGYTTVHEDDLGIGQVLERTMPYFDYVDPMVYPSHYNAGFAGLKNVNSDPGRIVKESLVEAVRRAEATITPNYAFDEEAVASTSPEYSTSTKLYIKPIYNADKIRPWLQAFDYPVPYTPEMVQAQIKANEESGLGSYLMWDASNKYRSLREVLK